jgi:hypothetical protein
MELQTHTGMPHVIPSAVAATLIMLIYVLAPRLSYRLHLARLPACNGDVGKGKELQPYFKYASNIYRHGYEKVGQSMLCRPSSAYNIAVQKLCMPDSSWRW